MLLDIVALNVLDILYVRVGSYVFAYVPSFTNFLTLTRLDCYFGQRMGLGLDITSGNTRMLTPGAIRAILFGVHG